MADFVQTMKDWHRMCKAMTDRKPNDACDGCKLEAYGCSPVYEAIDSYRDIDFVVVGETIRAWAAEHPEPVYPTWYEWLTSIGAVTRKVKPDVASALIETGLLDPIPADIAQKLAIEPKEG